jgi:sulfatase maturation enzyme AslB (radical SAM superfamily)
MDNITWHIEPTSKCILECPLCDRTWFYKKFKKRELHEINIYHLVNFLKNKKYKINFCGNTGDPIYHSEFHRLCLELKKNSHELSIVTNGSKKSTDWWEKLGSILTKDDVITFSIDGLEETNKVYRINSDWESIIKGFDIIKSHNIKTVWKFIVFKHNEHQVEEAEKISRSLGFDHFRLEKSDRWLDENSHLLKPSINFVDSYNEHQVKVLKDSSYTTSMSPACLDKDVPKNNLYIDAEGNFYPCCWIGTYRYKFKSIFSPKKLNFNIKNYSVEDIIGNKEVIKFFQSTKNYESAHNCCKLQCGVKNG